MHRQTNRQLHRKTDRQTDSQRDEKACLSAWQFPPEQFKEVWKQYFESILYGSSVKKLPTQTLCKKNIVKGIEGLKNEEHRSDEKWSCFNVLVFPRTFQ